MAKPTQEQLTRINRFARRPLTAEQVEVYENLMIDTLPVTSHGIIISDQLMEQFEKDANNGVPQMLVHNTRLLPVGKVFEARLVDERVDRQSVKTLYGTFYVPLEMPVTGFDNVKTDDLVKMIDVGTLSDTSIGFSAEKFTCNICGNDIRFWWKCEHIPGQEYAVDGQVKTCWAIAEGRGGLHENSLVYSGACDRASLLSTDGKLEDPAVTELFTITDIKKAPVDATLQLRFSKAFGMHILSNKAPQKEGSPMTDQPGAELNTPAVQDEQPAPANEELEKTVTSEAAQVAGAEEGVVASNETQAVQAEAAQEEVAEGKQAADGGNGTVLTADTGEIDLVAANVALQAENEQLKAELAQAKEQITKLERAEAVVEQYRSELTKEILTLGVKAQGNAFNSGRYEKFLATLGITELKETAVDFRNEIKARFGNDGSRITSPEVEQQDQEVVEYADMDEDERREFLTEEAKKLMASPDGKNKGLTFRAAFAEVREKFGAQIKKESE